MQVDRNITVIIPALNEAAHLPATLDSIGAQANTEIIVADGGSGDGTVESARRHHARVVESSPGRAVQMNAGAAAAHGEVLMFLHADTRLPAGWRDQVLRLLAMPGTVAGAFRLAFDETRLPLSLVAAGANCRSTWRQLPYGDQALFLPRKTFHAMGGFRELPVMEDYAFVRRLRKQGRIAIASTPVVTSARRCTRRGAWRSVLLHQCMILGWHLGVSPQRIARWRADVRFLAGPTHSAGAP